MRRVLLMALAILLLAGCGGESAPAPQTRPPLPGTPAGGSAPLTPAPAAKPPTVLQMTLAEAQAALDAGDFARAEAGFLGLTQREPRNADAHLGLGNTLVRQNRFADAESAYQAALDLDPQLASARSNLGVVYYSQMQLTKAAQQFKLALELKPGDPQTLYLLAAVRIQEGNLAEAEKLLNQAKANDPNLAEIYYGLGAVYKQQNRKTEAIAAFEKFIALGGGQDPNAKGYAEEELKILKGQ